LKLAEVGVDLVEAVLLMREIEKRRRIPPRHARCHWIVRCHVNALAGRKGPRAPGISPKALPRFEEIHTKGGREHPCLGPPSNSPVL
jgi:hypothetical protein